MHVGTGDLFLRPLSPCVEYKQTTSNLGGLIMNATMTVQECLAESRFWYQMYVDGDRKRPAWLETAIAWLDTAKKLAEQEVQDNETK